MSASQFSVEAAAALSKGHAARRENRLEDARAAYTRAVNLARNSGDTAMLAETVKYLGKIERDLGEIDASLRHYQEAAALIRTLNHPLNVAHTIRHIADILREKGEPEHAAPYYDEALILYRRHPKAPPLDLANALRGLALNKADLGDKPAAIQIWQEAATLYQQVNVPAGVAESERQIALLTSL
jgi:tetratricopeptide (TPR) repeat protein